MKHSDSLHCQPALGPVPQPVWDVACELGEGPIWIPEESALRFVDIRRGCLHRWCPSTGATATLDVGGTPSFIVPTESGGLLIGMGHELRLLQGDRLGALVARLNQPDHNRTNDATVGADGRLWFGTMDDREEQSTGTIWCLESSRIIRAGGAAVVTNGPAISCDGRHLFFVDSSARRIWRHRIGGDAQLENAELFVELEVEAGYPDGIIIDSEDCLWVALWDGWGVRRYAPDGKLLTHIAFPCARVTKIALGGSDLRTAFVTTARTGLSDVELTEQPLAGALFAFVAPAAGRIVPAVQR